VNTLNEATIFPLDSVVEKCLLDAADSLGEKGKRVIAQADRMLEVLELNLLRHAQETAVNELDKPFMDALNAVRKARIHYIDRIGGKVFGAYDWKMRPYRNLGGTPLFKDA